MFVLWYERGTVYWRWTETVEGTILMNNLFVRGRFQLAIWFDLIVHGVENR